MKRQLALVALVLTLGLSAVMDAEAARRLGGGKSSGMQRDSVTAPAKPNAPAATPGNPSQTPAAAPAAGGAAAAAAAAPKRSWMGPIAGIAAGLGLAALASHLGFGQGLANIMLFALLAMVVFGVVVYFMRRRAAGAQGLAGAGGNAGTGVGGWAPGTPAEQPQGAPAQRSSVGGGSMIGSGLGSGVGSGVGAVATSGAAVGSIPADFDVPAFERNAKAQFLALQEANDAADLNRLRDFLSPDMFDAIRRDLDERGAATQRTEVYGLNAQVLDVAEQGNDHVVSVRFSGSIRHEQGADTEDLAEVWHLSKPRWGSGGWVVAGIQQAA